MGWSNSTPALAGPTVAALVVIDRRLSEMLASSTIAPDRLRAEDAGAEEVEMRGRLPRAAWCIAVLLLVAMMTEPGLGSPPEGSEHDSMAGGVPASDTDNPTEEAEGHGEHHALPHHHLALVIGAVTESKEGHEDEHGLAVGIEYEFRFHERWGVGVAVERLSGDHLDATVVALPVSLHPSGGLRLMAGPGIEFAEEGNESLWRLGAGYEFEIGAPWTLAPEIVVDFISGGGTTWVAGIALGRQM